MAAPRKLRCAALARRRKIVSVDGIPGYFYYNTSIGGYALSLQRMAGFAG
jgi:hypothetical protein